MAAKPAQFVLVRSDPEGFSRVAWSKGAVLSHYYDARGGLHHFPDHALPAAATWKVPENACQIFIMEPDPSTIVSAFSDNPPVTIESMETMPWEEA